MKADDNYKQNSLKLLIISKDSAVHSCIKNFLNDAPLAEFELERASEFSQQLTQNGVDIVLLDLCNGYSFREFIQLKNNFSEIPIIVMVPENDENLGLQALKEGAQDYLIHQNFNGTQLPGILMAAVERQRFQNKNNGENARHRAVVEKNADGIIIIDEAKEIRFANPAAQAMLHGEQKPLNGEKFDFSLTNGNATEISIEGGDGKKTVAEIRVTEIFLEDEKVFLATLRDITHREEKIAKIQRARRTERQLAYYDVLTSVPNRQLFYERLKHALVQAKRYGHKVAVIFLDLDKFKQVNDSLGHGVGDLLLKSVAARLKECIRDSDSVARFGGDEFTIVLDNITQIQDIAKVAKNIITHFEKPFHIENNELRTTMSIGISLYPNDGNDVDTLINNADVAMYRAKNEGGNNYQFYNALMDSVILERLEIEKDLKNAIYSDELVLHYQPQVEMNTNKIVGVEALVRWQHPVLGLINPSSFISLAEETGLIVPLGEWVLHKGCEQNKRWQECGLPPIRIAINFSARQFRILRIEETIKNVLAETGLKPEYLVIEITESSAMLNVDYTVATLTSLREMGVKISLDDFGTGYASLSYLKRFPLDILKIDRSFIKGLHDHHDDWAIVSAIVAMAHRMKLTVLAEGVENAEQLVYLQSLKCDEFQGYYVSRPIPADEIVKLLDSSYKLAELNE